MVHKSVSSALLASILLIIFGLDETFGSVQVGTCPSYKQGTVNGTCEMSCNHKTGGCRETRVVTSCNCDGQSLEEVYYETFQDGHGIGAVGRRKRQAEPYNVCDRLPQRCEDCRKIRHRGKSTASANSESRSFC